MRIRMTDRCNQVLNRIGFVDVIVKQGAIEGLAGLYIVL